jgi:phosphatidylethanolamine-binding protein (PEBP) family uncharacterized protein
LKPLEKKGILRAVPFCAASATLPRKLNHAFGDFGKHPAQCSLSPTPPTPPTPIHLHPAIMSLLLKLIEYALGRLLYRRRAYDKLCFFNTPAFSRHPHPDIAITSPDCGDSGAKLSKDYSKFGAGRIPELSWPPAAPDVKEYLLLTEDPDAPFGHPNVHGIYCFIPATTTSFGPRDLKLVREDPEGEVKVLESGYRVGKNRRNWVYIPPRPVLGHGPHRYFFELVALNQKLDPDKISKIPTKEELAEAVKGKVCGWGIWTATYENVW